MPAPYTSFVDLRADVLDRAGEPQDGTSDYHAAAGRFVVRAYQDLCNAHPYLFLQKYPPGAFVTVAPYETGQVQLTQGSATATLTNAPDASLGSFAGRKLVVTGIGGFYRISTHTAGSATLTLDVPWQDLNQTGITFKIVKDEYALASDARHVELMTVVSSGHEIPQRSVAWEQDHASVLAAGWPPSAFVRIADLRIRLVGYPLRAERIEYVYTQVPPDITGDTDGTLILVPQNQRQIITDGALYLLFDLLNDDRKGAAAQVWSGGRERLIEDDSRKRTSLFGPRRIESGPYR